MASLEERVAAIEARLATGPPPSQGAFWALERLRELAPAGAILYTGVVPLPPAQDAAGERYEWQHGTPTGELLDLDWSELAPALAALAHPVRLRLLREILGGRRSVADLGEGLGTTGQLYHHLRQLTAAGWLRAAGRGHYAVPPERVVPLLTVLAAARH
ncbi:ArsR/SmtB family transcription factor [Dactylosporangium sucinum]|uniref:Transcriptional regulator n=1 Tax=Dactylosporangium sucinum TaxID=1424081 RepID=A0A917X252_9ACTN|nr:helix-turn-helix domain-containing protein [Dactylosporangium sucinum]GGM55734.1 transcriptional regulator [Dactylosporangium sucinum]